MCSFATFSIHYALVFAVFALVFDSAPLFFMISAAMAVATRLTTMSLMVKSSRALLT